MKMTLIFFVAAFVLTIGATEGQESASKETIKIPGTEAQAIAIGVREFEKHQGTKTDQGEPVYGDLRHYNVELVPMQADVVEVGFIPKAGPKDIEEHRLGGRGEYGIETHYEVSLSTLKVLRQTFAR